MPYISVAKCPPMVGKIVTDRKLLSDMIELAFAVRSLGYASVFGNELKAAHHYEANGVSTRTLCPPVRRYFFRPAFEPFYYSLRHNLLIPAASHESIDTFMTLILGKVSHLRNGDVRTIPESDGSFTMYPSSEYAKLYLERIRSSIDRFDDPFSRGAFVFAETIASHPYFDGNGRLARALMFSSLAHDFGVDFFELPFGPVSSAQADLYISGLKALSLGKWQDYGDMMTILLREATFLVKSFLNI